MNNLWLKIRIWTKVTIAVLLGLYVLLFIVKNSDERAHVWWMFGNHWDLPLLVVLLMTFLFGVLITILTRTVLGTARQIRELRSRQRSERLEQEVADMRAKTARLQTRPEPEEPGKPE